VQSAVLNKQGFLRVDRSLLLLLNVVVKNQILFKIIKLCVEFLENIILPRTLELDYCSFRNLYYSKNGDIFW
jgi:hypothetical protein